MHKYIKTLTLLLAVFIIASCASQPLPPPERVFEKNAINLWLKSDPNLNYHEGMSHTLLVCVYQLRDPNGFNQLVNDEDGLYTLLECSGFDGSVVNRERLTVHPDRDLKISLSRAEGAKYLAVVAGYYSIRKEDMTKMYEIPVLTKRRGFLWLTKYTELGPMELQLLLGKDQILSSRIVEGD